MLLSSTGRSHYLQEEVLVHLAHGARADLNASYVHSSAREDLNSLLNFVDVIPQPIVGVNEYAAAVADAHNRVLFHGHVMPTGGWLLVGTVDWRSGLPYSETNEDLEFVHLAAEAHGGKLMLGTSALYRMCLPWVETKLRR